MKKLVAALTTAFVAVALVVVGAAAPVEAHTPTLSGSATCNAASGTWTVTYHFATTNVPTGVEASTKVTAYSPTASTLASSDGAGTGTNLVLSTYSGSPQSGVQTRTGNWTATLTQTGVAASQTQSSLTIHTDWSDKVSGDASYTVDFSGSCGATPPSPPATPKDASASVSKSAATCSTGETLVLGKAVNASWAQPSYSGSKYTVVATADSGHKFADGSGVSADNSTDTFTGTLAGKLSPYSTACAPATPPVCIPSSAVSYTYSPGSNSGVITVADVPNSTGKLCSAFYVTATSWKYTMTNSIWPQALDQVNKYYIDSVGTYPYGATVTCGQGDIYAATAAAGQPIPPQTLLGPNNPWHENFLHNMGFSGPAPTYHNDANSCLVPTTETGTPTVNVATCKAPTANTVSLPAVSGGVWTVSYNGKTATLPTGSGKDFGPLDGYYGAYTITLSDANPYDAYTVTGSTTTWTPLDISTVDCNTTATPVAPTAHAVTTCGTTGSIDIPKNTDAIVYTLTSGDGHTGTNVVTATAQAGYEFAPTTPGGDPTKTVTYTFDLGTPTACIDLTPSAPSQLDQTCVSGAPVNGSITVENQDGLTWEIVSADKTVDIKNAVGTTSNLLPGTYTVTATVDNSTNPNYVLAPGAQTSWTETIGSVVDCRTIAVTASTVDAQCAATPNGATPKTYVPATVTISTDKDVTWTITDANGTVTAITPTAGTPVPGTFTENLNPGTYTVTAALTPAAQAAGSVLSTSSWGPFTINAVNCTVQTAAVSPPEAVTCAIFIANNTAPSASAPATVDPWVYLDAAANVTYTIALNPGGTPVALVQGYNQVATGTYTVTATADNGYVLDSSGATTETFTEVIPDLGTCIPTGASWHAGASADPATCVSATSQEGSIHLVHLKSEIGEVSYTITNQKTGAVIHAGSHSTSVKVAPGEYTVKAKAVKTGDGISTASTFPDLVVAAAATACSSITTTGLAFTGQSASFGVIALLLGTGLLFLGFAAVFIRRANRRNAN